MDSKQISNLVWAITLGLATAFAIQGILKWTMPHLFNKNETSATNKAEPGQIFIVPTLKEKSAPINSKIQFEEHEEIKPSLTEIKTSYGSVVFSSTKAGLEQLNYISENNKERILTPIDGTKNRGSHGIVIALREDTPYNYVLSKVDETESIANIYYEAETKDAKITKHFEIDKKLPKIDLNLTIEPTSTKDPIQARIFIPTPVIKGIDSLKTLKGVFYNNKKKIERNDLRNFEKLKNQFWFAPKLFGSEGQFFISALIRDKNQFTRRAYYEEVENTNANTKIIPHFILEGPEIKEKKTWNLSFYLGPKDTTIMSKVDKRLEKTVDYGILSPLVKLLLSLLKFIYKYVKNYGWAILLLTLLIRLLMIPLTFRGQKAIKKQKEFQRKMQYLEQKYKDDKERLNKEKIELTRKYGVSNILGCLPQLIQLPVLISLNKMLYGSIELYKAPFILWIKDLSAIDPYYVLPIASGIGVLIQMTMESDAKRSMMVFLFAGILVVVTANFSAGMTLFIFTNAWAGLIISLIQKNLKL